MFTGIVEELGEIIGIEQVPNAARLRVHAALVTTDAAHGDSISVNGVCLTVVDVSGSQFIVDVVHETVRASSLAKARAGDRVNVERALAVGARLGGHIVQGHVDGTGVYLARDEYGLTTFALPPALAKYVVEKGSIGVDGVSLTVASLRADQFQIALIPTTLELTTLGRKNPGDLVNLEVDVLAKYVEKLASPQLSRRRGDNRDVTEEDASA